MAKKMLKIMGQAIPMGTSKTFDIKVSETGLGTPIYIPIKVTRSKKSGPTLLLIAGIHGDETNGVVIVRDMMIHAPELLCGTLICVPVVNIFGFEENSRYLPDRRDLNRCFPGKKKGSLGYRLAKIISDEIVSKCSHVIDLHTGGSPRSNYPQIRGDMEKPEVARLAKAFGTKIIMNGKGHESTLRHWATENGIATVVFESGETNRYEPATIKAGLLGIKNVLKSYGMIAGNPQKPLFQVIIQDHSWIRTDHGGILQIHVKSGSLVCKGTIIASCLSVYQQTTYDIVSPHDGIVVGLTTQPTVKPGEPICNLGILSHKEFDAIYLKHPNAPETCPFTGITGL